MSVTEGAITDLGNQRQGVRAGMAGATYDDNANMGAGSEANGDAAPQQPVPLPHLLASLRAMWATFGQRFGTGTQRLPARRAALPFVLIGLLLVVRALLTPAPTTPPSAAPGPAAPIVNHYAPDVTLRDTSGNAVQLSSLRGKVVLLNFWYASCPGCQIELPALEQQYTQSKASGFVVVGLDVVDDAPTAVDYAKRVGITYPIFLDDQGRAFSTYHVTVTPSSYLVDRNGVIRATFAGPVDEHALAQDVAALLAQK